MSQILFKLVLGIGVMIAFFALVSSAEGAVFGSPWACFVILAWGLAIPACAAWDIKRRGGLDQQSAPLAQDEELEASQESD